jgi:hypothetical protein
MDGVEINVQIKESCILFKCARSVPHNKKNVVLMILTNEYQYKYGMQCYCHVEHIGQLKFNAFICPLFLMAFVLNDLIKFIKCL